MKKRLSLVLFVLLMVGYILPCFAVSADNSLGVVDGVAQIGTEAELRAFAAAWMDEDTTNNYSAKLTADIALTSEWVPFNFGDSDGIVTVTFDGNGHTISNLDVKQTVAAKYIPRIRVSGFFGEVAYAEIKNLTIAGSVSVKHNHSDSTNDNDSLYIGGIVGWGRNLVIINNCISAVSVSASHSTNNQYPYSHIGGIVGNMSGYIINCASYGNVSLNQSSVNSYSNYVGGICGFATEDVYNSFASGTLSNNYANGSTGGISGYFSGYLEIKNCVFNGSIVAVDTAFTGGIYGNSDPYGFKYVFNCYSNHTGEHITNNTVAALNGILKDFEEDYGIKLKAWKLNGSKLELTEPESIEKQPTTEDPTITVTKLNGNEPTYQWQMWDGPTADNGSSGFEYSTADNKYVSIIDRNSQNTSSTLIFTLTGYESVIPNISFNDGSGGRLLYKFSKTADIDIEDIKTTGTGIGTYDIPTELEVPSGKNILCFLHDKGSATIATTAKISIGSWKNVATNAENGNTLLNVDCDGKLARCIVTYPDGQNLTSDTFIYDHPDGGDTPGGNTSGGSSTGSSEGTATKDPSKNHAPIFFMGTTVRVYDADNGTITPNGIPMIIAGMTKTFKFIPDEGYVVADVIVNGESIGAVESYTIDGWQGYVKLTAVFEAADDGE